MNNDNCYIMTIDFNYECTCIEFCRADLDDVVISMLITQQKTYFGQRIIQLYYILCLFLQIFCILGAMFGNEVNILRVMPPADSDAVNLRTVLSTSNLEISEREQSPGSSSEGGDFASPSSAITVLSRYLTNYDIILLTELYF